MNSKSSWILRRGFRRRTSLSAARRQSPFALGRGRSRTDRMTAKGIHCRGLVQRRLAWGSRPVGELDKGLGVYGFTHTNTMPYLTEKTLSRRLGNPKNIRAFCQEIQKYAKHSPRNKNLQRPCPSVFGTLNIFKGLKAISSTRQKWCT